MLTRVVGDPGIDRKDAIILPVISFEIKDIVYSADRKLNTMGRNVSGLSNTSVSSNFNPVPYDIHMDLWIYVKNNEDAAKIVEQIVPFFTPDFTIITSMFPNVAPLSVPIILDGVRIDDDRPANFTERTTIIWNLGFTIKGSFYGPVKNIPIINVSNVNISTWDGTYTPNTTYKEFGLENITDNRT